MTYLLALCTRTHVIPMIDALSSARTAANSCLCSRALVVYFTSLQLGGKSTSGAEGIHVDTRTCTFRFAAAGGGGDDQRARRDSSQRCANIATYRVSLTGALAHSLVVVIVLKLVKMFYVCSDDEYYTKEWLHTRRGQLLDESWLNVL